MLRVVFLLLLVDIAAMLGYLGLVQASVPSVPKSGKWPVGILFFADFGPAESLGTESRDRVDHTARLFQ